MDKITDRDAYKDACIVIPIYKDNIINLLNNNEIDSINNTLSLMHNYDIYFLCNDKLNLIYYKKLKSKYQHNVYFKYYNFNTFSEYSKMCLDYNFYQMFESYKYMLICQTDAWIFKDELLYWCNKGYDYIGSPWLNDFYEENLKSEKINHIQKDNIRHYNGGFSLRNIKKFIYILSINNNIYSIYNMSEDLIISQVLTSYFKLPSYIDALNFSHEQTFSDNIYEKLRLPFGCHTEYTKNKLKEIYKI